MQRRFFSQTLIGGLLAVSTLPATAQGLSSMSERELTEGIRAALERGALAAVALLGKPDGFLADPKVRIPLPGHLQDAARLLRLTGQGRRVDELETAMNRAAENAVPLGRDLLLQAVRGMGVSDARRILTGGDQSVTDFFAERTRSPLADAFLPVVTQATQGVGLANAYNRVAGRAQNLGLVKPEEANVERYVTGKTLDALYLVIGEQERQLRQDPLGAGSELLRKVFGALR
jgi:hypothetical protein